MLINRKINPLLEALQYYNRRVNGTSVSDTMIRLENAYPERVHEIHSTVAPILDLDNLLSAELVPDMDRLNFFFKQFEGVNGADSIGTSAASIIFFEEAYKNFDAADELFEHMSKFSRAEIRSNSAPHSATTQPYSPKRSFRWRNFGILPSPALSPMKRSGEYLTHTGIILNMCRNFRTSSVPQWTL